MSIKPILFNTEMVRAILDGRKTVTRRVVKLPERFKYADLTPIRFKDNSGLDVLAAHVRDGAYVTPPYRPGDILYVRETWFQFKHGGYAYRADSNEVSEMMREDLGYKWRPSIHMPREAARIWLRVTDVRVERLQEVTEEQAQAEGFRSGLINCPCSAKACFIELWDSTIKPADRERCGWAANPFVWVIEFERCEKPKEGWING